MKTFTAKFQKPSTLRRRAMGFVPVHTEPLPVPRAATTKDGKRVCFIHRNQVLGFQGRRREWRYCPQCHPLTAERN